VHDRIELLPLRIVIEDDRTEFFAVERPVGKDNFRAKEGGYLRECTGSRNNCLACEEVCVNDRDARGTQESRHGRLACSYAACQTNDCNGESGYAGLTVRRKEYRASS